ncbi:MAG: methyl-accepting chemotaxis protein [Rubrivivax sp.]
MLTFLKKPKLPSASNDSHLHDDEGTPRHGAGTAFDHVINTLASQASALGQEAAEVRGAIDDTDKAAAVSIQAISTLAQHLDEVEAARAEIDEETRGSQVTVADARAAVEQVGCEVSRIVDSLREVGSAAGQITQIALQTRLVAFNASVEAKRAGAAGRGFAVVADAVRDLAGRVEASSQQIMSTMKQLDERVGRLAREIQNRDGEDLDDHDGKVHRALASVERKVKRIQQATQGSRETCDGLRAQMGGIQDDIRATSRVLRGALSRTDTLLQISEQLLEAVADAGVHTGDTPYIDAVKAGAGHLSQLLQEALAAGHIREAELFDEQYVPVGGSNPPQHTTRFSPLAERIFPSVQEKLLQLSPKVVFAIAVDRNGYVPMHNSKYSQAQRADDPTWNAANSRWRRIFNDRTGLASARNQKPFLLQTYRRDMGGGKFVVMKEAAAPITVHGRHWGGLRLAFHF